MVEAGMPAIEAIQSATITNAKVLGVEDELGQITSGYTSDIVVTDDDPTKKIGNMTKVSFVMKEGKVYKR